MYRVGTLTNPLSDDPSFLTEQEATLEATLRARRCSNTPIAVWDADDEVVTLMLAGQWFQLKH